jgi:cytochrome P450
MSDTFQADPYPTYGRLRSDAPVHRRRDPNGIEVWTVNRYEDARAALADRRLSKDPGPMRDAFRRIGIPLGDEDEGFGHNMLNADPPDHTRLRRLVSKAFTPRRLEGMRRRVQEITDGLLDRVQSSGAAEIDLIDAFAFPLPVTVICELLGVPVEDRDDFRAWSNAMITPVVDLEGRVRQREGARAMRAYLTGLVERRRPRVRTDLPEEQQPDLVSALIAATDEEGALTHGELISMLVLLLIAGHETTVNLIGNGTVALLRHPDQLDLLRSRPDLLPSAVEELLRYDGPVQRATFRYASEDVEVGGVTIPRGGLVSVLIGSADRDGEEFDDPDELDITRTDNHHVAFGHGIHFCLGAPLARMEGQIAFGSLFSRFPDLSLACPPEDLVWRPTGILRGLSSLPVRVAA